MKEYNFLSDAVDSGIVALQQGGSTIYDVLRMVERERAALQSSLDIATTQYEGTVANLHKMYPPNMNVHGLALGVLGWTQDSRAGLKAKIEYLDTLIERVRAALNPVDPEFA